MPATDFVVSKEKLEVEMHKEFDAPVDKVWDAYVNPDLVAKWWGPRLLEMHVEKLDAVEGGEWRILHSEPSGKKHWFHGQYREVVKPEKIVRTFVYEPVPEHTIIETTLFDATSDGRTKITVLTKFPSVEALEGMVSSGMEYGARESMDRLSELVTGGK